MAFQQHALIIAALATFSTQSLAVSEKAKDRGGSCTELCTKAGDVIPLPESSEGYFETYDNVCSSKQSKTPGNIYWCNYECLGNNPSTFTKIFNSKRGDNVSDFITKRKAACYELFKTFFGFDHEAAALSTIPNPREVPCNKKGNDSQVILKSNDEKCVQVAVDVAKQSLVIKDLLEDSLVTDSGNPIPLPRVDSKTLFQLVNLMENLPNQKSEEIRKTLRNNITIIIAAHYLNIPSLRPDGLKALRELFNLASDTIEPNQIEVFDKIPRELQISLVKRMILKASKKKYLQGLRKISKDLRTPTETAYLENGKDSWPAFLHNKGIVSRYTFSSKTLRGKKFKWVLNSVRTHALKYEDNEQLLLLQYDKAFSESTVAKNIVGKLLFFDFTPDDKTFFAVEGKTVKIWDLSAKGENPTPKSIFKHEKDITNFAPSLDSKYFLTADSDGNVFLWDATQKEDDIVPIGSFPNHLNPQLIFSPDSSLFAIVDDINVTLHNVGTKTTQAQILKHGAKLNHLDFSSDSKYVLTYSGGATRLWNAQTKSQNQEELATILSDETPKPSFHPNGKSFLTVNKDTVKVWDVGVKGKNPIPQTVFKHEAKVSTYSFSPDGSKLATGAGDYAWLWDSSLDDSGWRIIYDDNGISNIFLGSNEVFISQALYELRDLFNPSKLKNPLAEALAIQKEDYSSSRIKWREVLSDYANTFRSHLRPHKEHE